MLSILEAVSNAVSIVLAIIVMLICLGGCILSFTNPTPRRRFARTSAAQKNDYLHDANSENAKEEN